MSTISMFSASDQCCFDQNTGIEVRRKGEKYWMCRCYGNYSIAEMGGKIGNIPTNVKNTFIKALFLPRHILMSTVYWIT